MNYTTVENHFLYAYLSINQMQAIFSIVYNKIISVENIVQFVERFSDETIDDLDYEYVCFNLGQGCTINDMFLYKKKKKTYFETEFGMLKTDGGIIDFLYNLTEVNPKSAGVNTFEVVTAYHDLIKSGHKIVKDSKHTEKQLKLFGNTN